MAKSTNRSRNDSDLPLRLPHNPEVGGSSPPSATTKTAVFLSKTAVFFGPMAKFRRYGRICVVICLRISYNHAMGRATGGRLLSGADQCHRFPVRISGRRYAGGGHAAARLAAPVGAGYAYICAETAGRSLGDEERAGLRNRLSAIRETDTFAKICLLEGLIHLGDETPAAGLIRMFGRCNYRNQCAILNSLSDVYPEISRSSQERIRQFCQELAGRDMCVAVQETYDRLIHISRHRLQASL